MRRRDGGAIATAENVERVAALGKSFVAKHEPVRRALTTRRVRYEQVQVAARAAFVDHNVHMTRARTGVLVFVSWFERRVIVVADVGVPLDEIADRWEALAERLDGAIKKGNPETFLSSLRYFGAVLAEVLPRSPDDENELPDDVQEAS